MRSEKIIMLGPCSVGKTSICSYYVDSCMPKEAKPTVGTSVLTKEVKVNGQTVRFAIWDTAGTERFLALGKLYFRDARAAIVVTDLTNPEGLKDTQKWIDTLRNSIPTKIPLFIAGNKVDLEESRAITTDSLSEFATINEACCFHEVSAKTGANIPELFDAVIGELIELPTAKTYVNEAIATPSKGKCC